MAQRIDPNTFFDAIPPSAGVGQIEKRAFDVASYGRQLGLITEVVLGLAENNQTLPAPAMDSLERLKAIHAEIENIKIEEKKISTHEIEAELKALKTRNAIEFDLLRSRLLPLLAEG